VDTTRHSLLIRIRDPQDGAAWREFDRLYRPLLTRYARARGLSPDDTEDVVQHCMAAVQQHIGTFEYDPRSGRFKSWLCTLVINRIRNLHRGRRERIAESGEIAAAPTAEPSPEEVFEKIWVKEHVRHCLDQVRRETDELTYTAFRRYALDEEPVEQVCTDLGINANKLYKIKWQLTQKLREKMVELLGESEAL